MLRVPFLNKNLLRKYPFKQGVTCIGVAGQSLPDNLIASLKMSVPYLYRRIFVERVVVEGTAISVTVSCKLISEATLSLGVFNTALTDDYQLVNLTGIGYGVSGQIVFGELAVLEPLQGNFDFTADTYDTATTQIEESLITVVPTPVVTSISCRGNTVTGNISLVLDNIKNLDTTVIGEILLNVINKPSLYSRGDKSFSFGNCTTPVIGSINDVPPDANGNIDIFGIKPVVVSVLSIANDAASGIKVEVADIKFEDLCSENYKNVPPKNITNIYYLNLEMANLALAVEEWKSWPQWSSRFSNP
jgi:hypothetical protein